MDEVLARSGIFQGVDHDAAEALAKEMETIDARKGEVVFSEGEPGDSLYIVLSGKIKVGRRAADGRQNLIAVMGPSDMVGELSLFDPGPRTATATAVVDTRLARLRKQALRPWLTNRPEIAEQLLRVLARRLRRTNDALADLIFTDVPGRVAKNLLQMAGRFGTRDGGVLRVTHDLTQEELAQLVGASRETVNKALADFASRGWLRLDGKSVIILDPERLARRAARLTHPRAATSGSLSVASRKTCRLDCLFAGSRLGERERARPVRRSRSAAAPPSAAARRDGRLPGRVRLGRHDHHPGRRTGRRLPGSPAAPLPDQGGAGAGGRQPPVRAAGGGDPGRGGRRARAAGRRAGWTGWSICSPRRSPARCSPPRSSCGWPPAPTPTLRRALVPLEARVGREMHRLAVDLLGADERRPGVRPAVQATLDLLRGLGVANLLGDDTRPPRRHSRRVEAATRRAAQLRRMSMVDVAEVLADLAAESSERGRSRGRPAGRRLAEPTPGRRLDDRPSDRPPGLDRSGGASLAITDPAAFTVHVAQAAASASGPSSTTVRSEFLDEAARPAATLAGRTGRAGRR